MLLLRGATSGDYLCKMVNPVSIHAPLARSNLPADFPFYIIHVSIHAPLARSNPFPALPRFSPRSFNTCSSCEEQLVARYLFPSGDSFNTCSSCEEQLQESRSSTVRCRFNTCSSCEEQRSRFKVEDGLPCFNTCSSCEEQHVHCYI